MGPSGSGKSTFLQIVGTLDSADDGMLLIDGHDVTRLSDRARATLVSGSANRCNSPPGTSAPLPNL
ncbi:MAG: ATP-binding cassette domain-containing protein [Actinomycetales bacterium]